MSILARKTKTVPAVTTLTGLSVDLRTTQDDEATAAKSYLNAARAAQAESDLAAKQATAVEQATQILIEAGL